MIHTCPTCDDPCPHCPPVEPIEVTITIGPCEEECPECAECNSNAACCRLTILDR